MWVERQTELALTLMLRARSRPRISSIVKSGSAATSSSNHRWCASSSERLPPISLAATDPVCRRRATHRSPNSVPRTPPQLHGRTLLPPLNAPPVHADHANRTSASLSPESDPKRFAHQHAFENPLRFASEFNPIGLCWIYEGVPDSYEDAAGVWELFFQSRERQK
jgi:hypothetical protein